MAATLLSGGGGKEASMWEGTGADPNGVNPETTNGEPTTPSPGDPGAPATAAGASVGTDVPTAGRFTLCHLCTVPKISRSVVCKGCHNKFHWACVGFYDHNYQKPGPSWRCKECKLVQPTPADAPGKGGAGAGARASSAVQPPQPPQPNPNSGQAIDVGEQAPGSTTPSQTAPPAAPVLAWTADALPGVQVPPVELGTVAGAAEGAAAAAVPQAGAAASAVTVQSPMAEHVCPFCRKGLGRKRTLDCSVCHKPWHAVCVNVRGAETPKSWVCRDCKPGAQATAGTTPRNTAVKPAASPSAALEKVSDGSWAGNVWIRCNCTAVGPL